MLSRITNPGAEEYELLRPYGSTVETKRTDPFKRPAPRAYQSYGDSSYQPLEQPFHQRSSSYASGSGLLRRNSTFQGPPAPANYWKSLLNFVRKNTLLLGALAAGISISLVTFGFTFWLSRQIFSCPDWSIRCNVKDSVHTFISHLGLVQGFVSSVYGISIASLAYATYQLAESTVWPMLTEQPFTLEAIDRYIAHTRGSLPSFPLALWHTRRSKHVVVVLIVGILGLLLQAAATIVGWAFTVTPVPTHLHSNHTIGGGIGFGFNQTNPPGPRAGAPSDAIALYTSWANPRYPEVLPDLREFIFDRANFSAIGNFTAHALHAPKTVSCHPKDLVISTRPDDLGDYLFIVNTTMNFGGGFLVPGGEVLLRFLPNQLSVWVDNYQYHSETRVTTNLMFAIVNGTIENGANNRHAAMANTACMGLGYSCTGISSIACDVDVELSEGRICNGECQKSNAKALTSLEMTTVGGYSWGLAFYLGAISSILAPSVFGAQPTYATGYLQANSSYALPIPFLDLWPGPQDAPHWSIANLTNFINVTAGALGTTTAQHFPAGWTIVESVIDMPRLDTQRSYSLLAPPAIALLCFVAVAALSFIMHKHAGVETVRLASTSEILVRSADGEVRSLVDGIRAGYTKAELLETKTLWFGQLPDGRPGLGSSVQPLAPSQRSSRAPSYQDPVTGRSYI